MASAYRGTHRNDFTSYAGPGDRDLPMTEVQGYQPVSRIGEVVMNAYVPPHLWEKLPDCMDQTMSRDPDGVVPCAADQQFETKPHFHEWATVMPGMICVAEKRKDSHYRRYMATETAVPVISSCACLPKEDEKGYFFAGVCRSKSVRSGDDGIGPSVDEFFTVSIGGMVTVLNTSGKPIHPGDSVKWTFVPDGLKGTTSHHPLKRRKSYGPRRICVKTVEPGMLDAQIIGRALSYAKPGESFDILLKQ